ncbi:carboxypeptidase cpdS precursor [Dothidotthia symphoricarpi CBS 119687]|uniref:Carboxypeptidase n=1 Tax=Dothidotthia symphoricarpi CBS 119687 TaxID=1392245 RepID=A0A6A6A1B3_9PLEO|nr:carboxypeptidase cpdS precursor [Dothidotthia symphoricarpi CBS 119687]KAF2125792.1 carboxypeptidase cpdS precursor [Dothidotthia symphoricarpi CBS 119687]
MQLLSIIALGGLTASASARSVQAVGKKASDFPRPRFGFPERTVQHQKRQATSIITTDASKSFTVNGTAGAIPDVDFDIGESYAGLLPISSKTNETSELYFWFFPSENEDASDEITIWLNGGPGCSSLEGFLQENGPISWQYGSGPKPVPNDWTWKNLTNMVWVEQPVGTGFTQGTPTATSQEEVAEQFLGFFKNFVDTFGLKNRKVYITGESYAGRYVPYIADAMLSKNDTEYYNAKGIMFYDPSVAEDALLEDIPAAGFLDKWAGLFNLNESFTEDIHKRAAECGYTDYMETYLTFPPPGKFPTPENNASVAGCAIWGDIFDAVLLTNPCFDVYAVATTCPLLWDPLGFPGSFDYVVAGTEIYFNRTAVQKAINAPIQPWAECSGGVLDKDTSPQSSWEVIPRVIEKLDRTIIVHGELDYILLFNGTLMAIQNMTWGGLQGFQTAPSDKFYVPYHDDLSLTSLSAKGEMGITHTERKLTWVQQALSGHMVPQYQPSSAYRQLEFLLGRIESLTSKVPFTTLGSQNGTVAKRDLGVMNDGLKKWY